MKLNDIFETDQWKKLSMEKNTEKSNWWNRQSSTMFGRLYLGTFVIPADPHALRRDLIPSNWKITSKLVHILTRPEEVHAQHRVLTTFDCHAEAEKLDPGDGSQKVESMKFYSGSRDTRNRQNIMGNTADDSTKTELKTGLEYTGGMECGGVRRRKRRWR